MGRAEASDCGAEYGEHGYMSVEPVEESPSVARESEAGSRGIASRLFGGVMRMA